MDRQLPEPVGMHLVATGFGRTGLDATRPGFGKIAEGPERSRCADSTYCGLPLHIDFIPADTAAGLIFHSARVGEHDSSISDEVLARERTDGRTADNGLP